MQVLEDFLAAVLHIEPRPTHIAGRKLDLTIMVNGDSQDLSVKGVPELLSDHWMYNILTLQNTQRNG